MNITTKLVMGIPIFTYLTSEPWGTGDTSYSHVSWLLPSLSEHNGEYVILGDNGSLSFHDDSLCNLIDVPEFREKLLDKL